jgi:hypothetical protein
MAEFEAASHDEIDTDSYDEILGGWSRPVHVYPMIKLKSLMDAGEPMRVTAADYGDPLRRWL